MRHRKRIGSFGRRESHRKATLKHLVTALFKYQRIETTTRKAKETRRLAEHIITIGKKNDLTARRRIYALLANRDIVVRIFNDVVPLFKDRQSGYTRIMPLGFRKGDGASMVILELTEKKIVEKAPKKEKAQKKESREAPPEKAEMQKDGLKKHEGPKPISKAKLTLEEEKARERARSEEKKIEDRKGFLKNLRGRFRRRRGTDS